jgi:hypothetical protein
MAVGVLCVRRGLKANRSVIAEIAGRTVSARAKLAADQPDRIPVLWLSLVEKIGLI